MIYQFQFTRKPFASSYEGQVECDNFYQWFMLNAPYGVRLKGKPKIIETKQNNLTDYTKSFKVDMFKKEEK